LLRNLLNHRRPATSSTSGGERYNPVERQGRWRSAVT